MILTSCHEMPYFFSTEKILAIPTASYQHSKYWQQRCCELEVKIQGDTQDKKNGNSNTLTVLNNWVVCGVAWALSDTVVLHSTKKKKKKENRFGFPGDPPHRPRSLSSDTGSREAELDTNTWKTQNKHQSKMADRKLHHHPLTLHIKSYIRSHQTVALKSE